MDAVITAIATEVTTQVPLVASAAAVVAGGILALKFGLRLLRSFVK